MHVKMSEQATCKICGFKAWYVDEIVDHLRTHKKFNDDMDKTLPGFSDRSKLTWMLKI